MSLSVILVPLAIGVASVTVSGLSDENTILDQGKTYYELKTRIKDEKILEKALNNYGNHTEVEYEKVTSNIGGTTINFLKGMEDNYNAYFHEDIPLRDAEQFMESIYSEYTKIVQQETYEKLLTRAKNEGLLFESEETKEDETIVLTFGVKE